MRTGCWTIRHGHEQGSWWFSIFANIHEQRVHLACWQSDEAVIDQCGSCRLIGISRQPVFSLLDTFFNSLGDESVQLSRSVWSLESQHWNERFAIRYAPNGVGRKEAR